MMRMFIPIVKLLFYAVSIMALTGCSDSNVEKGAACLQLGDYEMAQVFFNKTLMRNPRDYDARVGMGKALLQRAVDNTNDTLSWREACLHLDAARTLRPSAYLNGLLSQAWFERSRVQLDFRDTLGALTSLTHAIEYDPGRAEPLNAAGIIYFHMGEAEKALAILSRAAALDSGNVTVLFNLGMIRWHSGDINGAHGLWLRALKRSPKDETVLYWFALAEKKLRESDADKQLSSGR
jgi:tetratricopeptide (TPR) repeat protein